ncbi:MAG TPA: Na/Pi cotransporter family protein, partial [Firmicutes bacterium]|nr:Na/Pi cotransporter family protein [Candidatus Fermentithermobacillaceae bacterium]
LIKQFTALIKRLVKGDEKVVEHGAKYLDPRLASTPFSAVIQLRKEVLRMAKLCQENLTSAINQFMGRTRQRDPQFNQIETVLDEIEEAIQEYVSKVSQYRVTAEESRIMTAMINIAADLERIGDHATAIAEAAEYKADNSLPFSEEAMEELSHMTGKVLELMDMTLEALGPEGKAKAVAILPADDTFDSMERDLRETHIRRLNEGVCFPASGVLYLDLLTHLERIGDHGVNIAKAIIDMPE